MLHFILWACTALLAFMKWVAGFGIPLWIVLFPAGVSICIAIVVLVIFLLALALLAYHSR